MRMILCSPGPLPLHGACLPARRLHHCSRVHTEVSIASCSPALLKQAFLCAQYPVHMIPARWGRRVLQRLAPTALLQGYGVGAAGDSITQQNITGNPGTYTTAVSTSAVSSLDANSEDAGVSSTSRSNGGASTSYGNTSSTPSASSSTRSSSLDPREAAKFAALADQWWNPAGPFAPLLALNPARCRFIREAVCGARGVAMDTAEPLAGLTVLDVGSGGGILSEALARMGAHVHGIDVSDDNVVAASAHAAADPLVAKRVSYQRTTAEELASTGSTFDVVIASEVIEHVRQPGAFMSTLASLMAADGQLVVSTINRTLRSYALAVAAAEYVLGLVPRGTHAWENFLTPGEVAMMAADAGLELKQVAGMQLLPLSGRWALGDDVGVNYIALLERRLESGMGPGQDAAAPKPAAGGVGKDGTTGYVGVL